MSDTDCQQCHGFGWMRKGQQQEPCDYCRGVGTDPMTTPSPEQVADSIVNCVVGPLPAMPELRKAIASALAEAVRAERAKWAKVADAAGHMRDWLYECSIDPEESHTVRNQARELVAAFDAAKEAK